MRTFFIIEGVFEGPAHSKQLRDELSHLGYRPTKTAQAADIIIAHSGGWVFLPSLDDKQLVILLDPAYRTGTSFRQRTLSRLTYDITHLRTHMIVERLWNIWYFIIYFNRWRTLNALVHRHSIAPILARSRTVVIGVRDTTWWHEPTMQYYHGKHTRIDGDHDAFWSNPHYVTAAINDVAPSERV